ncbi:MAG: hypothetical protein WB770_08485 [Acidimicrobiales bacterium]
MSALAKFVVRCRYVEIAGFHAIGARAIGTDANLAGFFAGASRAHGFRAELLESCLPVAAGFTDPSERMRLGGVDEMVAAFGAEGEDEETFDSLVGVFYPALRDAYDTLSDLADGPGDTSARRTFRRCRDDVSGVIADGLALRATNVDSSRARKVAALVEKSEGPFGSLGEVPPHDLAESPRQVPGGIA